MAKNLGGRPRIELDYEQLEKLCCFPHRQEDIAWIMNVSVDTLDSRIKEKYKIGFSELMDQKRASFRNSLLQKQFEVAMNGNVSMLIWLGKQYLSQTEKAEVQNNNTEIKRLVIHTDEAE